MALNSRAWPQHKEARKNLARFFGGDERRAPA
jgi:hypothetical protein